MTKRRGLAAGPGVYSGVVIAIGAALLVVRLPAARFEQPVLFLALLVASMVISVSKVRLPLRGGTATLSMSYFTDVLALMLVGADEAMLIAGSSGLTQCYFMSRSWPPWHRPLFSAAVLIVAIQLAGLAATLAGGFDQAAPLLELLTVTLAVASIVYVVNSALVAIAVARERRAAIVETWYREFLWAAPACLIGAASAAFLFYAAWAYLWAALLAVGPLFVTSKAYRLYTERLTEQQGHVQEVSKLHLASVEALARAIDARDQTIDSVGGGTNHIRRLQAWAIALAEAAGMRDGELEAVKVAALLHDIGKLAVPEHILTKPGRLTAKEYARVRIHPVVGAEIIKAVPFPYPVASYIHSHHERWDGTGYPDGLRGEETPLGARVLAVVDYFDALSSSRPYHPAPRLADAVETLRGEAGRALDPTLVELFLHILPTLEAASAGQHSKPPRDPDVASPADEAADERPVSAPLWVFRNISLATQEMRTLYDIAQTLGTRLKVDDTMALLSSKLGRLMPGSCWVLFLHDAEEDVLRCRFATGAGAASFQGLSIPCGDGPSGWAARQRTAVLNGCAASDFEAAQTTMPEPAFRSALSCSLVDGDQLIGTLTIYHVDADAFRVEHRHLLEHISSQVASVLRNAVAFERLRDVSFTDALTGLANPRALYEFLERSAIDARAPQAVIMIDVDRFKVVNDNHGHGAGDAALQAVASIIRAQVRERDFCARIGGDEFLIVLPGCDRAAGESRATDLQQGVAALRLETSQVELQLGISVGVSAFPEDGQDIDELMAAADKRMYFDKAVRRQARGEPLVESERQVS